MTGGYFRHWKLPTGAKAYFLLQAANLTIYNERLARATAKLDYADIKIQIQKVFGVTVGNGDDTLPIKTEGCNYTRGRPYRGRGAHHAHFALKLMYSNIGMLICILKPIKFLIQCKKN